MRFSELVNRCLKEGVQQVIRQGTPVVVVMSVDEYRRITTPKDDHVELDTSRPSDYGRETWL